MRISEFVGNESLARMLADASLPPAALFTGPSGVGKKTLALALAALANCHNPLNGDACGVCSSCLKIESRNHPDVLLVDRGFIEPLMISRKKKYNPLVIPIDVARELVREAQYRPFEGKTRVFIIDEAEKMQDPAANAMLKTLEEPAESIHLVLTTAYPSRLLPTIRSRCQTFRFRRLRRQEIQSCLERSMERGRARLLAAFADGSIGAALALDLETTLRDREVLLDLLTAWVRRRSFADLFFALEKEPLRSDMKSRERVSSLLDLLQVICQDIYFLLAGTPERLVNEDREEQMRALAGVVTLDWLQAFLYHVREAKRDVERYVNPLLCFETLWLQNERRHVVDHYRPV